MPNSHSAAWFARSLIAIAMLLPTLSAASEDVKGRFEPPRYQREVFPPWQKGENNDALNRGIEFTVPEVDNLADFHGDITDPKLVLYVGGNYFFAMAPLVKAFEERHQEYKGKIYWFWGDTSRLAYPLGHFGTAGAISELPANGEAR